MHIYYFQKYQVPALWPTGNAREFEYLASHVFEITDRFCIFFGYLFDSVLLYMFSPVLRVLLSTFILFLGLLAILHCAAVFITSHYFRLKILSSVCKRNYVAFWIVNVRSFLLYLEFKEKKQLQPFVLFQSWTVAWYECVRDLFVIHAEEAILCASIYSNKSTCTNCVQIFFYTPCIYVV